ncbi:MAG TPA: hypothetical protein VHM91_13835, partial [Verrucomicrobiales bacterium]|nr:hypothetical protein [Verrucomicrobiales bacterium]
MNRTLRNFTLVCQWLTAGLVFAQDPVPAPSPASAANPSGPTAPSRAVAVLVDVSGSVGVDLAVEARQII